MTSPVDIRPDQLEIVQDILLKHLPAGVKVWVFGSRANWTTKDSSDLDLALEGESKLNHKVLGALKDAFEDSTLPYTVDVVDLNAVGHAFKQIVKEQRTPLSMDGDGAMQRVRLAGTAVSGVPSARANLTVTPGKWREVALGECSVLNDSTYSPKEAWPIINYLDTGNITENRVSDIQQLVAGVDEIPSRARRKVRPGDIVYSTVRPNQKHFGLLKNIPDHFLASTGFAVMRGRDGIADTGFLYWFLAQDHIVDYLHSIAENSTSAYPSIRPSDLEQLTVSLPPLPEQRAIAHVLGTLDDKIELNRRMNETLEAMARALFKSWFVDFEPVRAKMEGRWRLGESLPGLPAKHYDLFPDRLVDSELGVIPEGWGVKALPEIMDYKEGPGIRHWQYTNSAEGTRFINIRCIQDGDILLNTANRIGAEEAYGKYAHFHLKEWDIVVSTSGTLGRSAVVRSSHLPLVLNTSVIRFSSHRRCYFVQFSARIPQQPDLLE